MTTETSPQPDFDQRYERADALLDILLEKAASPFTYGPERRAAKIGAMKAFILVNCARHPEVLTNLETVSAI